MSKKLEALEEIQNNYDAFYIVNKYGAGTHNKEFELLNKLADDDNQVRKALGWIKYHYDCYYKAEYDNEDSAFGYLKALCGGENK